MLTMIIAKPCGSELARDGASTVSIQVA